jgi:hypothetical protein
VVKWRTVFSRIIYDAYISHHLPFFDEFSIHKMAKYRLLLLLVCFKISGIIWINDYIRRAKRTPWKYILQTPNLIELFTSVARINVIAGHTSRARFMLFSKLVNCSLTALYDFCCLSLRAYFYYKARDYILLSWVWNSIPEDKTSTKVQNLLGVISTEAKPDLCKLDRTAIEEFLQFMCANVPALDGLIRRL